ncbi:protein distal antenna-related [Drosophila tropicalis]|uniref:protein distal antenna-related n=1 Tax=Drosophila tropicalis TaxID=46794 RepID=UPI0035AC1BDF
MEKGGVPRGKRPRVQVSLDDKERAIARIRNGETKAGISRELGVPESTVRGWVKRAEQRIARDAIEQHPGNAPTITLDTSTTASAASATTTTTGAAAITQPLVLQNLKLARKRTVDGLIIPNAPPTLLTSLQLPTSTMPMISSEQTTLESSLNQNGWLHIFNAGILSFTCIATAAYMQANSRGMSEHLSMWQIINDYVDEAGRIVANNNGQYVEPMPSSPEPKTNTISTTNQTTTISSSSTSTTTNAQMMQMQLKRNRMAPRLHITAEDDEDGSGTGTEMET